MFYSKGSLAAYVLVIPKTSAHRIGYSWVKSPLAECRTAGRVEWPPAIYNVIHSKIQETEGEKDWR